MRVQTNIAPVLSFYFSMSLSIPQSEVRARALPPKTFYCLRSNGSTWICGYARFPPPASLAVDMGATVGKLHDDTILDIAIVHTQIARYFRNTPKNTTAVL